MTREERELAIMYLEEMKETYIEGEGYERHPLPEYYAIESAIKALEQEPNYNSIKPELNDCISRKDTIDWLKRVTVTEGVRFETGFKQILHNIELMPSVQPKTKTELNDCIRRRDVIELISDIQDTVFGQTVMKGVEKLPSVQPKTEQEPCEDATLKDIFCMGCEYREQEPCDDCISRQAVLDTLDTADKFMDEDRTVERYKAMLTEAYEVLSPVNPKEPKTVIYSGDGYADGYMVYDMAECPKCGYEYEDGDKDWGENFCPHCGQALKWESEVEE